MYEYNRNNWLQKAEYGTSDTSANITLNANQDYTVSNITYDANGNILTLNRKGNTDAGGTNDMDDFTYHYPTNKNQHTYVSDTGDNTDPDRFDDLRTQTENNYRYNSIGQLEKNMNEGVTYKYNAAGLVTEVGKLSSTPGEDYITILYEDYNGLLHGGPVFLNDFGWSAPNVSYVFNGIDDLDINCHDIDQMLKFNMRAPNLTISRNFEAQPNVYYTLDFDLIFKQRSGLNETAIITVTSTDGTILTQTTLTGGDDFTNCTTDFMKNNVHLDFVSTTDTFRVSIEMQPNANIRKLVLIDNVHLQAAVNTALAFFYDDRGHRIRKQAYGDQGEVTTTWYVRDASGNPMGIYTGFTAPNARPMPPQVKEHPVYGASRLGVFYRKYEGSRSWDGYAYQLTDHLGNVRAVIGKNPKGAFTISATDYYPFGSLVPTRHESSDKYRYGFNGMEKDDAIKGEGNSIDFGARMYDSRVGRFFTKDTKANKFADLSPYLYARNSPLYFIDKDGESAYPVWIINLIYKMLHSQAIENGGVATIEASVTGSTVATHGESWGLAVDKFGNAGFYTSTSVGIETDISFSFNIKFEDLDGYEHVKQMAGLGSVEEGQVEVFDILSVGGSFEYNAEGDKVGYGLNMGVGLGVNPTPITVGKSKTQTKMFAMSQEEFPLFVKAYAEVYSDAEKWANKTTLSSSNDGTYGGITIYAQPDPSSKSIDFYPTPEQGKDMYEMLIRVDVSVKPIGNLASQGSKEQQTSYFKSTGIYFKKHQSGNNVQFFSIKYQLKDKDSKDENQSTK